VADRLTGDTLAFVNTVTVRDLRNNGGEVLRRVEHGERIVVTRDGSPVAELRPLPRSGASPAELIRRRKNLPQVDPYALRRDIDNLIDRSL
jgi:prevent-host-death family protein